MSIYIYISMCACEYRERFSLMYTILYYIVLFRSVLNFIKKHPHAYIYIHNLKFDALIFKVFNAFQRTLLTAGLFIMSKTEVNVATWLDPLFIYTCIYICIYIYIHVMSCVSVRMGAYIYI
jgi:hypothetical protein